MTFYENYEIKRNFKYLIYFLGNFSIPHKGHIYLIKNFFNLTNVEILINVYGDENRHNIPIDVSFKIWNIYLKDVKNVKVEKYDPNFENILKYKNVDFVIYIRGIEENDALLYDHKKYYEDLIRKLRRKNIIMHFLFKTRIDNISTTLILEKIKKNESIDKYLFGEDVQMFLNKEFFTLFKNNFQINK